MPKKKTGKHLRFYIDCIKNGQMPDAGLCWLAEEKIVDEGLLYLFEPTGDDFTELRDEGFNTAWWGSGVCDGDTNRHYTFTPLRQTIVLFMAAINNEL